MRTTIVMMAAVALATLIGCGGPQGGGMSADEGFRIDTPMFTTQMKQGETKSVNVALDRGKYFKEDVTLEVDASSGLRVEPTKTVVRGDEAPEITLRITAAEDANLGEYKIFVTGTPQTGKATSAEVKVKVVAP